MIFRSALSGTGQPGCQEYGTSCLASLVILAENSGGSVAGDGAVDVDDGAGDSTGETVTAEEAATGALIAVLPAGAVLSPAQAVAVQAATPAMVIATTADLGFRKQAIGAGYRRAAGAPPPAASPGKRG